MPPDLLPQAPTVQEHHAGRGGGAAAEGGPKLHRAGLHPERSRRRCLLQTQAVHGGRAVRHVQEGAASGGAELPGVHELLLRGPPEAPPDQEVAEEARAHRARQQPGGEDLHAAQVHAGVLLPPLQDVRLLAVHQQPAQGPRVRLHQDPATRETGKSNY